MTVSVVVAVCLRSPLTPVMISEKEPVVDLDEVPTVSVEVVVAGFGRKLTVDPAGWPPRLNVTDPVKPLSLVMVTV